MRYKVIGCLFLSALMASQIGFSATPLSATCTPIKAKMEGQNSILERPQSMTGGVIYLLKNNSQKSLWIDHPTNRAGASAGWSSYLRPGNWSALLLNKKDFLLSCAVIQPGKVDYLNCAHALSVCVLAKNYVTNRRGSYWLVEDKSHEDLLKGLVKRGIQA
jgi:hypothetical protein